MEKIFYTDKSRFPTSLDGVREILAAYFNLIDPVIARTEEGKPFLQNPTSPLFFSVTHTKSTLFIAFSGENVGIDAELLTREPNLPLLLKRFSAEEREEIVTARDFLLHWTVKESAIKWLGESLSSSLRKLTYVKERLLYEGLELPAKILTKEIDGHMLSICSERDFSSAEIIEL